MLRRRRRLRGEKPKASIDMNSLIDLTFLLLVTFIVTLPALEQGISIMLPQAKTDELPTKNKKANTITVDKDNVIFLNDKPLTLEELERGEKLSDKFDFCPESLTDAYQGFVSLVERLEMTLRALTYSPVKGPEGNIEFLVYIERSKRPLAPV